MSLLVLCVPQNSMRVLCELTLNFLVLMTMMNTGMGAITVQKRMSATTSQNT